MRKQIKWIPLIISLAISLGTGVLSALLTSNAMEMYANMEKPPLAPPGWLFPVVWTILYILMGVAAYLVYITDSSKRESALRYYVAQLIANLGWSLIFFRLEAYRIAFFWLLFLWYLVFQTTRKFCAVKKTAGYLMIPYIVWITFAAYLNWAIAW